MQIFHGFKNFCYTLGKYSCTVDTGKVSDDPVEKQYHVKVGILLMNTIFLQHLCLGHHPSHHQGSEPQTGGEGGKQCRDLMHRQR